MESKFGKLEISVDNVDYTLIVKKIKFMDETEKDSIRETLSRLSSRKIEDSQYAIFDSGYNIIALADDKILDEFKGLIFSSLTDALDVLGLEIHLEQDLSSVYADLDVKNLASAKDELETLYGKDCVRIIGDTLVLIDPED